MTKKIDSKILLILLLFAVSAAFVVFIFKNINETYEVKAEVAGERLISEQYRGEIALLNSIRAQEKEIRSILLQFGYKIPASPEEEKIIEYISGASGEAELLGITFSDRVPNDIAVEMPLKVTFRSDYFTMIEIIKNIVGAPRLYTVRDIDITSSDGRTVSYTINLSAYYA